MSPSGDGARTGNRLARVWRALAAARRQRAAARASRQEPKQIQASAEDERVIVSQRLDAARERLRASIAPRQDEDQTATNVVPPVAPPEG